MRLRKLRELIRRLKQLQQSKKSLTRDALLLAVGQAKEQAGRVFGLVDIRWPQEGEAVDNKTLLKCLGCKSTIYNFFSLQLRKSG